MMIVGGGAMVPAAAGMAIVTAAQPAKSKLRIRELLNSLFIENCSLGFCSVFFRVLREIALKT
jgi:hypothetical protein